LATDLTSAKEHTASVAPRLNGALLSGTRLWPGLRRLRINANASQRDCAAAERHLKAELQQAEHDWQMRFTSWRFFRRTAEADTSRQTVSGIRNLLAGQQRLASVGKTKLTGPREKLERALDERRVESERLNRRAEELAGARFGTASGSCRKRRRLCARGTGRPSGWRSGCRCAAAGRLRLASWQRATALEAVAATCRSHRLRLWWPSDALAKHAEQFAYMIEKMPELKPLVDKVLQLLNAIPLEDIPLLCMHSDRAHPRDLILTRVPVPPNALRPSVVSEPHQIATWWLCNRPGTILTYVTAQMINSENSGIPTQLLGSRSFVRGYIQRLKGKQGRFRGHLSGKRANFTARNRYQPDPNLRIDQGAAFRVSVKPYRTLRFNECCCTPFNADFDGDEMNLHVPQTEEARAEAKQLMASVKNMSTPRNGEPLIAAIQDFHHRSLPNHLQGCVLQQGPGCSAACSKPAASGKAPPSTLTAKNSAPTTATCWSAPGELLAGRVDKKIIGSGSKENLVYLLLRDFGGDACATVLARLTRLIPAYLSHRGFSIGLGDVTPRPRLLEAKAGLVRFGFDRCRELIRQYEAGTLPTQPGCSGQQTLENAVSKQLSDIRDEAGK
uniref:DNA-directed RNA polymerase subunit n=1 Tax=Macrostomum lignano TaxID=282301 RepID=A0A1I8F2F5_9PLAT